MFVLEQCLWQFFGLLKIVQVEAAGAITLHCDLRGKGLDFGILDQQIEAGDRANGILVRTARADIEWPSRQDFDMALGAVLKRI